MKFGRKGGKDTGDEKAESDTVAASPGDPSNAGLSKAGRVSVGAALLLGMSLLGGMAALWQMFGAGDEELPQLALFLGHFHPVFVHIPVGLLVAVLLIELLALVRPWRGLARNTLVILWISFLGAAAAIVAGFLLKSSGEYGGQRVESHMWLGFGVALGAWAALIMKSAGAPGRFYLPVLGVTVVVLTLAGHLGGTITHGPDYLVKQMPEPYKSYPIFAEGKFLNFLTGGSGGRAGNGGDEGTGLFYDDYVAGILAENCIQCHGEDKQKGKLRLDTHAFIMAGAEESDYPNVVAGKPEESEMIVRVKLPLEDDDHMPPEDEPQLTEAELGVLEWWVEKGASANLTAAEARKDAEVAALLKGIERSVAAAGKNEKKGSGDSESASSSKPAESGGNAKSDAVLKAIEAKGYGLRRISQQDDGLEFNAVNVAGDFDDAALALFEPVAGRFVELQLAKTKITDASAGLLGKMESITTLHLQNTAISDAGVAEMTGLDQLEHLNLYGTKVTDAVVEHLLEMDALKRVYLWQTGVTEAGASRLRASREGIYVDMGYKEEEPAAKK